MSPPQAAVARIDLPDALSSPSTFIGTAGITSTVRTARLYLIGVYALRFHFFVVLVNTSKRPRSKHTTETRALRRLCGASVTSQGAGDRSSQPTQVVPARDLRTSPASALFYDLQARDVSGGPIIPFDPDTSRFPSRLCCPLPGRSSPGCRMTCKSDWARAIL